MSKWDEWKERNADWWEVFVAFPVVIVFCLAAMIFYLPMLCVSYGWHVLTRRSDNGPVNHE